MADETGGIRFVVSSQKLSAALTDALVVGNKSAPARCFDMVAGQISGGVMSKDTDDERVQMITHAIGRVVIELKLDGDKIAAYTIAERLDVYRRLETNPTGKGIYRDAAELVRTGRFKA